MIGRPTLRDRFWLSIFLTIGIPILATFETTIQSIISDWFNDCVLIIDKNSVVTKDSVRSNITRLAINVKVIGQPYRKVDFILNTAPYPLREAMLEPGQNTDRIEGPIKTELCPGPLCPGVKAVDPAIKVVD